MTDQVPFNRPAIVGRELEYLAEAVARGHSSGDGPFTKRCEALFEQELGVGKALLTTSCTHALEMTALLLDLGPGDEVIVPSFTFVSTANAYAMRGATPVFADVRPDTLNIDETRLDALVTERTRAIVVVHYAGVACEMDALVAFAERHQLVLVEDNAHGLFGTYRGRSLGSFGTFATLSFHETKNFICGEGGALLVNDPAFVERAEILREKGTNRRKFFRGEIDKYSWVDLGSSYVVSDLLAAYLFAQLERREHVLALREAVWRRYADGLAEWAVEQSVALPQVPEHCGSSHHMFHLLLPTPEARTGLIAHLRDAGIHAVFHYLPLHLSPMGRRLGGVEGQCPVTESASERLVRLPFFNELGRDTQGRIIDAVLEYST